MRKPYSPFMKRMTSSKSVLICLLMGLWGVTGCDYLTVTDPDAGNQQDAVKPIARAHDAFLYPQDVEGVVKPNTPSGDSAAIMERFVSAWVQKQLMLQEAASKIDFDEAEIERKMLDYRYALMVYQFQKYYVEEALNKQVSAEEIKAYYDENPDNFLLKQHILRGKFVKLAKNTPQIDRFRDLLRENRDDSQEEIRSYCFRVATNYILDDTTWINFEDVVKGSPWNSLEDREDFLKRNTYVETEDEESIYFLLIEEYKLIGELSPLEFVTDQIRQIILNRRKVELTEALEKEVYQRAKEGQDFEIYSYE